MKQFYSQQGEDLFIYLNLINQNRKDGTYLELGAWDGLVYSNTKFFQDELSFKGLLIEPIPDVYQRLVKNRSLDICENKAITSSEGSVTFMGNEPTAGVSNTISSFLKSANHKNSKQYSVDSLPLFSILNKHDIKYLDIFFLDVEGGEYEVLKSMNWEIPIYIVCIELDGTNQEKDLKCKNILKDNGFVFLERLCSNEFWINPNYFRKDLLFAKNSETVQGIHHFMEPHCKPEILSKCFKQ